MDKAILISHSSRDDEFVAKLCQVMEAHGLYNWIDSHDLRGGTDLTLKIQEQIEKAKAFIVVLSSDAFNSAWVAEETRYALQVRAERPESYPIVALLREGVELGALKWIFSKTPIAIRLKNNLDDIYRVMPHILVALGESLPNPGEDTPQTGPVEELVLELNFPYIMKKEGRRCAVARAELTYVPSKSGEPLVKCTQAFLFVAPLGPIEIEELRWYLERYYLWPTGAFKTRVENVEKKLPEWGYELYRGIIPEAICGHVLSAWRSLDAHTERRFTVFVDAQLSKDCSKEKQNEADEAASLLLGLPWELIHDGKGYLFQGARSIRARRKLPGD